MDIKGAITIDFAVFISKVTAEMKLKGLTQRDVAKMTKYTYSTINRFMCINDNSRGKSIKVAKALSKALNIEL